jgi:hypothetical protein
MLTAASCRNITWAERRQRRGGVECVDMDDREGEVWSKANNLWTNIQTTLSPLLASEKGTMRGISYQRVLYPSWPGRDCDPHTPWLSVGRDSADRETERKVKRETETERYRRESEVGSVCITHRC